MNKQCNVELRPFQQCISYLGGRFYWWMKTEYPEEITNLQHVTQ